jgi:hypothetical protein
MTPAPITRTAKVQLHLLIAAEDRARLAALARENGETMSTIVRRAVRTVLSRKRAEVA